MESVSTTFCTIGNKTFFGKKMMMFGDFTLKIYGKLKLAQDEKSAGHWVCSCGSASFDENSSENATRWVAINALFLLLTSGKYARFINIFALCARRIGK